MQKNAKQNYSLEQVVEAKQNNKNVESKVGYGNKKLEGPNRPAE